MLPYCPPNTSQPWDRWHDHGVSACLLETVCTAAPVGLLALLGAAELLFYRRHGTALEHYSRPRSHLFRLQVSCWPRLTQLRVRTVRWLV